MAQADLKIRSRPKSKQPILPWTVDLTRKLIDFYHVNRILWDPTFTGGKNIARRDATINSFLEINCVTSTFSVKDVKAKWKVLRTVFWDIYKKTEKRLRSGKYGDEEVVPTWPYFKPMSFMAELKTRHQSSTSFPPIENGFGFDEDESIDYIQELPVESSSCNDEEDDSAYSPRITNGISMVNYKAEIEEISDEIFVETNPSPIAASTSSLNEHSGHFAQNNRRQANNVSLHDMEDYFGKYVSAKLQEMDTRSRDLAQFEIMQILMKYKYPESVVQQ